MNEETRKTLEEIKEGLQFILEFHQANRAIIDEVGQSVDANFSRINERLNRIESELKTLSNDTSNNFTSVDGTLLSIKDEIGKIKEVSRYDELAKNMELLKGGAN